MNLPMRCKFMYSSTQLIHSSRMLFSDKKIMLKFYLIFAFYQFLLWLILYLNKWNLCHLKTQNWYFESFMTLFSFSLPSRCALILYIWSATHLGQCYGPSISWLGIVVCISAGITLAQATVIAFLDYCNRHFYFCLQLLYSCPYICH